MRDDRWLDLTVFFYHFLELFFNEMIEAFNVRIKQRVKLKVFLDEQLCMFIHQTPHDRIWLCLQLRFFV